LKEGIMSNEFTFAPQSSNVDLPAARKWFAVHTRPRHEKRVADYLRQREVEHYLPLYRADRKWRDGSKGTIDLPLFPGYLFVHIKRDERLQVLLVPGTLAFIGGTSRDPAPVPEEAIRAVKAGIQVHAAEPHPLLTVGERARIRSGALAGREGVVVRKKNGYRLVIAVEQIGKGMAVDVSDKDLEPLGNAVDL
jgi:transcription antitermination factor NusG